MKVKLFAPFLLTIFLLNNSIGQNPLFTTNKGQIVLTETGAIQLAKLPLRCVDKEFPYKTGIVFGDSSMLVAPKNYHPAFFGCFDWHSSVHGHWMLARLLKLYPNLPEGPTIRAIFNDHFTPENMQKERALFESAHNKGFERTYGWAWLLQLQVELLSWNDPDAKRWAEAIKPLAATLSKSTVNYLEKLVYPIRVGEHTNLAFGLSLMIDYAKYTGDRLLLKTILSAATRYYINDKNCPINWEPGGSDFLSPCLEEANLMRKMLSPANFAIWLKKFMPALYNGSLKLAPGKVKDRTDGKLVHLDGLNLSRAWCLKGIATQIKNPSLIALANQHLNAALPQVVSGDYAGEHWLASFAVYALTMP